MKLKLTLLLVLFIVSGNLIAQTTPKFRFGLTGNTGYAWLKPTSKGLTSGSGAAAFGYGIMFDWNLGDNYAVSTGLDINYRGGSLLYNKDSIEGSNKVNLQYLEIPLLLKMKTKAIGYFTYFTSFGGSIGYTLSRMGTYTLADTKKIAPDQPPISVVDDKLNAYINPFSVSFIVNAGTEYNISGKTSLVGAIFFNNSFVDIATDPELKKGSSIEMSSRANVFGLKLGIFF